MEAKLIACRLPHGLQIKHPLDPTKSIIIEGMNKSKIIGAPYKTTIVPAEIWDMFVAVNPKFPALLNKSLFECKDANDAEAKGKEFRTIKTGFEGMPQQAPNIVKYDKD